jgi:hypothetical protein
MRKAMKNVRIVVVSAEIRTEHTQVTKHSVGASANLLRSLLLKSERERNRTNIIQKTCAAEAA